MILNLRWSDVALRLVLTIGVGLVFGYNRAEHGKVAGMVTTVLVCLAAAVAMLQVNFLLPTSGRAADSFVMNDLMRLPLGILTGVGFIGAGAILRRDDVVVGVTTAATLWLATVIGLCLGGGQIGLGLAAGGIGISVLWGVKRIEAALPREHVSELLVELDHDGVEEQALRRALAAHAIEVVATGLTINRERRTRRIKLELRRLRRAGRDKPEVIDELARLPGVMVLRWKD
jgi:putative Mg2+ transporter-C (MgtC) family protein